MDIGGKFELSEFLQKNKFNKNQQPNFFKKKNYFTKNNFNNKKTNKSDNNNNNNSNGNFNNKFKNNKNENNSKFSNISKNGFSNGKKRSIDHLENGNASDENSSFKSNKKLKILQNGNSSCAIPNGLNGSVTNDEAFKKSIIQQRHSLPIFKARGRLLKFMKENDTVLVIADTGVGKTTQIPQYLHEERLDMFGKICVTQPRRVAAISVSKRIADEMDTRIGGLVGFSVRFEDVTSKKTKLKVVTDGILLRESMEDPLLSNYDWIILDEAHERTICTDILFGIVKSAQAKRKKSKDHNNLHVIIMSATMNTKQFQKYFNNAPVLYIEGREHPVELFYANKKQDDYALACMQTVTKIHREAPPQQDILVFMTGQEEIDTVVHKLRATAKDRLFSEYPTMRVYPLYANLPSDQQLEVFTPTSKNERKVIVSTNIAETSLTIPGICFVVDSGKAKVRSYNHKNGFDLLKVEWVSQAQAIQRTGRAGRITNGFCYRVYLSEQFNSMKISSIPEIQRTNLSSVLLQLISIGVKNVFMFDFIDKPQIENIKRAFETLVSLKAITSDGEESSLTDAGKVMAQFPIHPSYSKIILSGEEYNCSHEVLTLVSMLSSESIFVNPSGKKAEAIRARKKFHDLQGDHVTLLKIYRAFKAAKESKAWCEDNYLSYRNLQYAVNVRKQLKQICERCNIKLVSCNQDIDSFRKCLITGLYTNMAELYPDGKYFTMDKKKDVSIHPSSVLFGNKPDFILYTELVHTGKTYMHLNSAISDVKWLTKTVPDYFEKHPIMRH